VGLVRARDEQRESRRERDAPASAPQALLDRACCTDVGCPEPVVQQRTQQRDSTLRARARPAHLHALRTSGRADGSRHSGRAGCPYPTELVPPQLRTWPAVKLRSGRHRPCRIPWQWRLAVGGKDMENANQPSEVPVSNWTLATGTRPGERHIYPDAPRDASSAPVSEGRCGWTLV